MPRYLLFIVLTVTACSAPFRSTVVITEPELQEKVERKFPLQKRVVVAKLSLENPKVRLLEDVDRVALDLDAALRLGPIAYPGQVAVVGDLVFDDVEKVIYFENAEVTKISIPDLPNEYESTVREAATIVLRAQLDHTPVHRLKGSSERMFVKSIEVKDRKVLVEVGI